MCTSAQQLALKGSIWGHMYISKDHKKDKAHLWIAGFFFQRFGWCLFMNKNIQIDGDSRQKTQDYWHIKTFFDKYG